jgi:hypothetical protein
MAQAIGRGWRVSLRLYCLVRPADGLRRLAPKHVKSYKNQATHLCLLKAERRKPPMGATIIAIPFLYCKDPDGLRRSAPVHNMVAS